MFLGTKKKKKKEPMTNYRISQYLIEFVINTNLIILKFHFFFHKPISENWKSKLKSKPYSIFGAKLDVITAQATCKTRHTPCNLNDLFFSLPQLKFHVNSTGGNEGMNPGNGGVKISI